MNPVSPTEDDLSWYRRMFECLVLTSGGEVTGPSVSVYLLLVLAWVIIKRENERVNLTPVTISTSTQLRKLKCRYIQWPWLVSRTRFVIWVWEEAASTWPRPWPRWPAGLGSRWLRGGWYMSPVQLFSVEDQQAEMIQGIDTKIFFSWHWPLTLKWLILWPYNLYIKLNLFQCRHFSV